MSTLASFVAHEDADTLNLGWVPGQTYRIQRDFSNSKAIFDTVLGYDEHGYVVVLRKQEGSPTRVVNHLTPVTYGNHVLIPNA